MSVVDAITGTRDLVTLNLALKLSSGCCTYMVSAAKDITKVRTRQCLNFNYLYFGDRLVTIEIVIKITFFLIYIF